MKRREFIAGTVGMGTLGPDFTNHKKSKFPALRFGICSDIHQDIYFDVPERLKAFVDEMIQKKVDFIIQLGDFCRPEPKNQVIVDIWNNFPGQKLHVIGNHDPENRFPREEVVRFWGAIDRYYSIDVKGFHLVILDGNDKNPNPARKGQLSYERYVSEEQLEWLRDDLDKTSAPVIIFLHQSLDMDNGVENAAHVRAVLERCNQKAGYQKVQAVFSGHHHLDYYNRINGIHYIQINSMSYHWQGDTYAESPFKDELNQKYPNLKRMNHYKDPLWAYIEISENGNLKMLGQKSQFVGKSPKDLGMPEYHKVHPVVPFISDRNIKLNF